jgi:hypothetical protein
MLAPPEATGHDVVLVIACEPLRNLMVELVQANGYDVRASATPLETIHLLERLRGQLRCAIISSQVSWAPEVWELLVDEYPDVEPIVLEN